MKFRGTFVAIIIIILMIIFAKFSETGENNGGETIYEPTEEPTLRYFSDTEFGVLPTE